MGGRGPQPEACGPRHGLALDVEGVRVRDPEDLQHTGSVDTTSASAQWHALHAAVGCTRRRYRGERCRAARDATEVAVAVGVAGPSRRGWRRRSVQLQALHAAVGCTHRRTEEAEAGPIGVHVEVAVAVGVGRPSPRR